VVTVLRKSSMTHGVAPRRDYAQTTPIARDPQEESRKRIKS
jgi:hypothetical protein